MSTFTQRAAAALELLPEDMQEEAVRYLIEKGEKLRALRDLIQEGADAAAAGHVVPYNMDEIVAEVLARHESRKTPPL